MTSPTALEFLDELVNVFGPDGEHWIKGNAFSTDREDMCLLGGLEQSRSLVAKTHWEAGGEQDLGVKLSGICVDLIDDFCAMARDMFPDRIHPSSTCSAIDFNDHDDTVFPDIRALIEKTRAQVAERVTP